MADLSGILESELARALRGIDRACMLAPFLPGTPGADRALRARKALEDAGIELPSLHSLSEDPFDRARKREKEDAQLLFQSGAALTVRQVALLAEIDSSTVTRRARRIGGHLAAKVALARRQGKPATFTHPEVVAILKAGER